MINKKIWNEKLKTQILLEPSEHIGFKISKAQLLFSIKRLARRVHTVREKLKQKKLKEISP